MTSENPIRNVSDTALWVAIYRAMESERPDAIFRDPYARRLGGERGQAIVDAMPRGKVMSWPMVVRTAVMDEIVLRCVRQGAATVLNLAAGLDARPYRLDLPRPCAGCTSTCPTWSTTSVRTWPARRRAASLNSLLPTCAKPTHGATCLRVRPNTARSW
jgi:hypothetical protein